jgi:hypothetical protein
VANALPRNLARNRLRRQRRLRRSRQVVLSGLTVSSFFAERGNHEVDPMLHESADKMHVARPTVEPGNDQGATRGLCLFNRGGKSWAQKQSIRSRACLHNLMLGPDGEPLALPELFDLGTLGRQAQAAATCSRC